MAKLTKSIRKENGYTMGGVVALLAFPTFLANGVTPSATYTVGVDGKISDVALDASIKPVLIESEDDKANFTENLTIGAGRYKAISLGFTLGGMSSAKSTSLEDIDLVKHTFVAKTRRGKYFVLGKQNGLIATQNNAGVAAGAGDLDGYDVIVSGAEPGSAPELTEAGYAALTLLVPADV